MSDMESDEDLGKFLKDAQEDDIRPIDIGGKDLPPITAPPPSVQNRPPQPLAPEGLKEEPGAASETALQPEPDGEKASEPEDFLKSAIAAEGPKRTLEELTGEERNLAKKGDFTDIMESRQHLKQIQIGCGWDQTNYESDPVDLDVSLFLLNRDNMTRTDEDFVFYNNPAALDGAVRHMGDSRTGAGDGDDEMIKIDLNGVPFDVMKIMIVLSVYDPDFMGHHIKMAKNVYVRIVDQEDRNEVIRYEIDENDLSTATAIRMAALVREGPKWYFEALAEPVVGGLAKTATEYGLIIQEMSSTGEADGF